MITGIALPAWMAIGLGVGFLPGSLWGQNLVPNPDFARGETAPEGWSLHGTAGEYARGTGSPAEAGYVRVTGAGQNSGDWRTAPLTWQPGGLYQFAFRGRRESGATGGLAVSGPSRVNRDYVFGEGWEAYRCVFIMPHDVTEDYVRLGQWEVRGTLAFDDAELLPVEAVHTRVAEGIELGEGESLRRGVYRFEPDFSWRGANYHRPLATNRASFNSNRWLFSPGTEVIYRHHVGDRRFQRGSVRVAINHHSAGRLVVAARRDSSDWVQIGEADGERRSGQFALPAAALSADAVWIRLAPAAGDAGFQVDTYRLEAELSGAHLEAEGATHFVAVTTRNPALGVRAQAVRVDAESRGVVLELDVTNPGSEALSVRGILADSGGTMASPKPVTLRLRGGEVQRVRLAAPLAGTGERSLRFQFTGRRDVILAAGTTEFRVSFLDDHRFGSALNSTLSEVPLWWCESGWKVGRARGLPAETGAGREGGRARAVRVSAAGGESEAVQVVLRPRRALRLSGAEVIPQRSPGGGKSGLVWSVRAVAYVPVVRPTDGTGVRGDYPDPLPELKFPWDLPANQNQPLWLTVEVPRGTPAGSHLAQLEVRTDQGTLRVPLEVEVYGFDLPRETHLRSALGLGVDAINRYHRLTNASDQAAVYDKYLANFAAHRISPYSFYDYAPIEVRFPEENGQRRAVVDFTRFDRAAAKALDHYRFNTFQLPVRGMGGGTFHSRHLGELAGFAEGTAEHARLFGDYLGQVERHLRERGWLDQAFTYWFDEPDPKDYAFVVEGMKRLKAAAPGIKRMLTEQPEPELVGHVDIWCGLTPEWTPERVRARRALGEDVWWYICTGPKAPYVTEFIDHPGTELRLWPWQSWQYGIGGILIWATIYWTSPLAYPEPTLQNPWEDPMSWVSGYGQPVGSMSPWGNGDGRFLYPPRRDPNQAIHPNLDGPIDSIRWENLRDGMEDYEYLWLLQREVERARGVPGDPRVVADAAKLLVVPPEVSRDLTHFTTDPSPILAHRERLARAIERLMRLR